jgi:D-glycero-beta-D-manno-heptose-7-phosphate kinase
MAVDIEDIFKKVSDLKVAVIGDIMLDTYWWGHVERISPEAPVPVVAVDKREQRIGGAGNVALNIRSLGASVALLSMTGNDDDGIQLKKLLTEQGLEDGLIYSSKERITTNKIRIISRNQQMMRLDAEDIKALSANEEEAFYKLTENYITSRKPDVVILEDYNKGLLTESLINKIVTLCNKHNIISAVDPKRKNFFAYKNVTVFKPNLKEVKEGLHILADEVNESLLNTIHQQLSEKLSHHISLITLSEKGVFFKNEKQGGIVPAHIRNVADVSGAGDTVIAVAALLYAATKDVDLMAQVANIAGGLVCEEVGTAVINKNRLMEECKLLLTN